MRLVGLALWLTRSTILCSECGPWVRTNIFGSGRDEWDLGLHDEQGCIDEAAAAGCHLANRACAVEDGIVQCAGGGEKRRCWCQYLRGGEVFDPSHDPSTIFGTCEILASNPRSDNCTFLPQQTFEDGCGWLQGSGDCLYGKYCYGGQDDCCPLAIGTIALLVLGLLFVVLLLVVLPLILCCCFCPWCCWARRKAAISSSRHANVQAVL